MELQLELANTEDRIAAAWRFYNSNVRDYNIRVESIPSSLVAGMGGFKKESFFNVEEIVRTTPKVET